MRLFPSRPLQKILTIETLLPRLVLEISSTKKTATVGSLPTYRKSFFFWLRPSSIKITFSSLEGTTNWSDSHRQMNVWVQVSFGLKLFLDPLEEALGRNRSKGWRELILPADAPWLWNGKRRAISRNSPLSEVAGTWTEPTDPCAGSCCGWSVDVHGDLRISTASFNNVIARW